MENVGKYYGTQKGTILGHLLIHGEITERDAFRKYNITCTAQRIYDLRKDGHRILMKKIYFTNRAGHKSYYGRYILENSKKGTAA